MAPGVRRRRLTGLSHSAEDGANVEGELSYGGEIFRPMHRSESLAARSATPGRSIRRRRCVLGRICVRGNQSIVQLRAYLLSGGTDRSPGVVQSPSRPQAELAYTALNSCHRSIDSNACALRRARLASLLTGRQANQCENDRKRSGTSTHHVASSAFHFGAWQSRRHRRKVKWGKNVDIGMNCETNLRSVACHLPCCAASSNREP